MQYYGNNVKRSSRNGAHNFDERVAETIPEGPIPLDSKEELLNELSTLNDEYSKYKKNEQEMVKSYAELRSCMEELRKRIASDEAREAERQILELLETRTQRYIEVSWGIYDELTAFAKRIFDTQVLDALAQSGRESVRWHVW